MSIQLPPASPTLTALNLAQQALESGQDVRLRVNGTSMRPLMRPGDVVVVRAVCSARLRRGDIVLIRRVSDVVTHRLVGRNDLGWHARGDGFVGFDPPFPSQAILGRVIARERDGKSLNLDTFLLRGPGVCLAWLAWILAPALAFLKARWS